MQNTRRFGQILRSGRRPRSTPKSGRGSRINCNTSHQTPVRVIEAVNARAASVPAPMQHERSPPQSPAPGFGEKYCSLSGFPSHSLESIGGAFLTVIFGQIFAYFAFS